MAKLFYDSRTGGYGTVVGVLLNGLIVIAWLVIHFTTIFVVHWTTFKIIFAAPFFIALQCWLSVGLFIVAHDTMHASMVPRHPGINRLIGHFCVFIYAGFSYDKLYENHHAHHRNPGTAEDPDFDSDHSSNFWPWYLKFFRHYFSWREFSVLTVAVVIYLLILRQRFPTMLAFWALPAVLSSIQLFYFGTYRPHRLDALLFADRHRARSDDFSPLISLLACFHFGYHLEHHNMPWVPWWKLPAQHRLTLRGAMSEAKNG